MSDKTHEINFIEPEFRLRDYLFGIKRTVGMFLDVDWSDEIFVMAICIMRREGKNDIVEKLYQVFSSGKFSDNLTDEEIENLQKFAIKIGCIGLPVIVRYQGCNVQKLAADSNLSLAENLGKFRQITEMPLEPCDYDIQFSNKGRTEMRVAIITRRELNLIKKICHYIGLRLLACGSSQINPSEDENDKSKNTFFSLDAFEAAILAADVGKAMTMFQAAIAACVNPDNLSGPIKPKFPKVKKEVREEELPAHNDSNGTQVINPEDEETVAEACVDPKFSEGEEKPIVDTRKSRKNTDEFAGVGEGDESPEKE